MLDQSSIRATTKQKKPTKKPVFTGKKSKEIVKKWVNKWGNNRFIKTTIY